MKKLIDICKKTNLTISQLYYLYSKVNKLDIDYIVISENDLYGLVTKGYIDVNYKVTDKGKDLCKKIDNTLEPKKKVPSQISDPDIDSLVEKYKSYWPNRVLPSGKSARVSSKVLKHAFAQFFKDYDYSWNDIFDATLKYLNIQQSENYRSCRTSQYFIIKTTQEKIRESLLADYCELIKGGDEDTYFKTKVV